MRRTVRSAVFAAVLALGWHGGIAYRLEPAVAGGTEPMGEADGDIPAGAVRVGDDLYMVPVGRDADGCERFTMFSRTKMVPAVIHYRDGKGGFTTDRAQADCG